VVMKKQPRREFHGYLSGKGEEATKSEAKLLERKLKNLSVKRTIEFILKYDEGVPSSDELLLVQKLSEC